MGGIFIKKILSFLLVLLLCIGLVGCSSNSSSSDVGETEDTNNDVIFEGYEVKENESGYYDCIFKVKNNTDKKIVFQGISIYELDDNGDILDKWNSYNQNAINAELDPGQSISFDTSHEISSGIKKIKSTSYSYIDESETWVEKDFLDPIIIDLKK